MRFKFIIKLFIILICAFCAFCATSLYANDGAPPVIPIEQPPSQAPSVPTALSLSPAQKAREEDINQVAPSRAWLLYDEYCKAVGGFAFNGDPLPTWPEFVTDPNKTKQAAAWIAVASLSETLSAPPAKSLGNTDVNGACKNVPDIVVFGNGDTFQLLCKASSKSQGWMKSTKAMEIPRAGCLVQVTTQHINPDGSSSLAEALTFVPFTKIESDVNGGRKLVNTH